MSLLHKVPLDVDGWTDYLAAHLPRGLAWSVRDSRLQRAIRGIAASFARAHARKLALYRDLNRNTMEDPILAVWEVPATLDMAHQHFPPTSDVDERRANVLWFIARRFGQTVPWYIALAARWGVTVTIDKPADLPCTFRVTTAGGEWTVTRMGDCAMGDCAMSGTATATGEEVQALFLRHKRVTARVIFND